MAAVGHPIENVHRIQYLDSMRRFNMIIKSYHPTQSGEYLSFPAGCCILNKNKVSGLAKIPISSQTFLRLAMIGSVFGMVSGIIFLGDFSQVIYGGIILIVLAVLKWWFDSISKYQISYSDKGFRLSRKQGSFSIAIPPNQLRRLDFSSTANKAIIETAENLIFIIVQKDDHSSLVKLVERLREKDPYLNLGEQIKPAENVNIGEKFVAKRLTSGHIIAFLVGVPVAAYSIVQFTQVYSPETWNYICVSCGAPFGGLLLLFSVGTAIKPQRISITSNGVNVFNLFGKQSISYSSIEGVTIESTSNPGQPTSEMMKVVKVNTGAEKPVNLFNLNAYDDGEDILSLMLHFVDAPVKWLEK